MRSTAEAVRARVLDAARREFAAYGLAGARIDRIAREASASKERLYAYFADKQALFEAVLDLDTQEFFEAATLDPADVPAFVGAVFDHALSTPAHHRMISWGRLDGFVFRPPDGVSGPEAKLAALRQAQQLGLVDPCWDAPTLIQLLFSLGLSWAQAPTRHSGENDAAVIRAARDAAVEAARRVIAPR
ncbi:TetR family transcriptional regulator [Subtercola boreus]|uniref:HTH tetR-type domain-containing protein n=1 Tax=Subtercola boreus TaxID=120213 RepID=A0A3E0W7D1_9MICO|nr:TetR family transcriptional regulator [Subtercola boreus]RFA18789.1 hypothetical protein B7R24_13675 [Subtercola boreus]RFA18904.1 hypothetical protein B7R23_13665 [Subtercola boreus]RFA25441.1 hypothetical protein B7R25_13775 [Subtercola boreus]